MTRCTIIQGWTRSERPPQAMLPNATERNANVIAREMTVTDHPVFWDIGRRNTGSENIAPTATQPSRPLAATITQRDLSVHEATLPASSLAMHPERWPTARPRLNGFGP
ncbi:MAG: hypothetical protein K0R56_2509 [Sphingomonas sp.]|nr:hypothetical protein [Sphingomonas sp.]